MQLSSELNRLYPSFMFEIIPIVLGATGLVPSSLRKNIEKICVKKNKRYDTEMSMHGSLRNNENSKSVLKMKNI